MSELKETSLYMKEGGQNLAGHHPLVLIGAFVIILRERFSPDQRLNYVYSTDVTGDVVPQGKVQIHVDSEYDDDADQGSSLMPRIVVRKGRTTSSQIALDNLDQAQPGLMTRGIVNYHHLVTMDIEIQVIAKTKAESAYLSYIVQTAITGGQKIIERDFYLRKISPVSTSSSRKVTEADTRYLTSVVFQIHYEDRWTTVPIESPVKKYKTSLSLSTAAEALFRSFVTPGY